MKPGTPASSNRAMRAAKGSGFVIAPLQMLSGRVTHSTARTGTKARLKGE